MRLLKPTLALALALSVPAVAAAQTTNCAARDKVIARLETGYGEKFAGGGLRNASSIFEVWKSEEKGTWTILMTTPDGRSCVMASGTNWREALPGEVEGVAG
ncbi:MAG: hypothetical protein HKN63_05165 [Rhodobacteraceae bacterium]|nr:hypothetical protein [Paracoccaceae bacterium]